MPAIRLYPLACAVAACVAAWLAPSAAQDSRPVDSADIDASSVAASSDARSGTGDSAQSGAQSGAALESRSSAPDDAQSEPDAQPQRGLTDLSLEDLLDIEIGVTSVSKREQPLSRAPAAVFVLTADEIRRSGLRSIPELLRLVPGVHVARLDANRWAISARGFNSQFANKMLVLLDGRSIYTPFFSGVFWDVQDVPLETIERIEVIRGPGAALWGTNAVNGVINILTKPAAETVGGRVEVAAGSDVRGEGSLRYGVRLGDDAALRLWAKGHSHGGLPSTFDGERHDDWWQGALGFRMDRRAAGGDAWMFEGAAYRGTSNNLAIGPATVPPYVVIDDAASELEGAHVLARYTHADGDARDWSVQAYVSRESRDTGLVAGRTDTFDVSLERHRPLSSVQALVYGLGVRVTDVDIESSPLFSVSDPARTDVLLSAFAQDEIRFDDGRYELVLGAKLEHNDFTGLELQPNARATFAVTPERTLWASIARALRSPSQIEQGADYTAAVIPNVGFDTYVQAFGNEDLQPEQLVAYELGYRDSSHAGLSIDVAAFYNVYDELISTAFGTPFPSGPNFVQPIEYHNHGDATSYGLEAFVQWTPCAAQRWTLGYTLLELDTDPETVDDGHTPANQVQLRYSRDLDEHVQLDLASFWVERLPEEDIDGYVRLDAHLEWSPRPDVSWSLGVQGLLHDGDVEFGSTDNLWLSSEQETAVYLQVRTGF